MFPSNASTAASQVDTLFLFLLAVTGLMAILIAGLTIFFAIKYRRRSEDELPEQIVGNDRLEAVWTILPLGFFIAIFFWGANVYVNMAQPPNDALPIYVVAKQWMWKFQHEGGQAEINELHVPVGRPIKLTMTAQDVIHSFFVPDFRVKQDLLPDRFTTTWFEAKQTGTYRLLCAQYCGTNHAEMLGSIVVMEPAAFQQWLSANASLPPTASAGQKLFTEMGCNSCHKNDGTGVGPSFVGRYGKPAQTVDGRTLTIDENYLRTCILNPESQRTAGFQPLMTSFAGRLNDEQLMELISYIKSLQ